MKKTLLSTIYLLISIFCFADNYMQLMQEYEGETTTDDYGRFTAALDFNGDSYDDLVVTARDWRIQTETQILVGKLFIYLGSEDGLAETPDITVTTQIDSIYRYRVGWKHLQNLGDMNNDGYEDLGFASTQCDFDYNFQNFCEILLGSAECDTIPDFVYEFSPSEQATGFPLAIQPMGDLNGDGFSDAGIITTKPDPNSSGKINKYFIVWGDTFAKEYFCSFVKHHNDFLDFDDMGDVNSDGFDDLSIIYNDGDEYFRNIYYGSTNLDSIPDHDLSANIPSDAYIGPSAGWCGDWNGDGHDDFLGSNTAPSGVGLWLGGDEISDPDYFLEFFDAYSSERYAHGDFNNDGYSDIALAHWTYHDGDGRVLLYLGGENGSADHIIVGEIWEHFGASICVGDFDGDGYDDLAIGGPRDEDSARHGVVRVYSGNGYLEETTEAIDDNEITEPQGIDFNAYPNPFNPTINFEIEMENFHNLSLEIFNIKGQKVEELNVKSKQFSWTADDSASAVYLCKLIRTKNGKSEILQQKKITLLK